MRRLIGIAYLAASAPFVLAGERSIDNPSIDMEAHLRLSREAATHRESRRLTEEEFIAASRKPGTVILDARSEAKYDALHVRGALNLSFPDITVGSLKETVPNPATRILIYCNNNFENAPQPFPPKAAPASLNLSTYITLYIYGYRNVYELGPLLDPKTCKLEFASTP